MSSGHVRVYDGLLYIYIYSMYIRNEIPVRFNEIGRA